MENPAVSCSFMQFPATVSAMLRVFVDFKKASISMTQLVDLDLFERYMRWIKFASKNVGCLFFGLKKMNS